MTSVGALLLTEIYSSDKDRVAESAANLVNYTNEYPQKLILLGGQAALPLTMCNWKDVYSIQASLLHSTVNLINKLDTNDKNKLFSVYTCFHASESIVDVLRNFPDSEHIQSYGLATLGALFSEANSGAKDAAEPIENSDICELVVRAMTAFPCSDNIKFYGLLTMANLFSFVNNHNINNLAYTFVEKLAGIRLAITAMEECPTSANIQLHGHRLLANLLFHNLPVSSVFNLNCYYSDAMCNTKWNSESS